MNLPLIRGAEINGVLWGGFANRALALHAANSRELLDWYGQGRLRPHVSRHLALALGIEAIRWLAERKAMGKAILELT